MGHFWFFRHHQYHIIMKFFIVALLCGGSLVAPGYVVSAAHCEYNIPSHLTVTVGDVTLSRTESSEQVFNVVQQVPHEQYSSSNQQNDIMIIVLSGTANLN